MIRIAKKQEAHFERYMRKFHPGNCSDVVVIRYGLSKMLPLAYLVSDIENLHSKLEFHRDRAKKIYRVAVKNFDALPEASIYLFADNDIVIAVECKNKKTLDLLEEGYERIAKCLPSGVSEFLPLKENLQYLHRVVEARLDHVPLMQAYRAMSNVERIRSLASLRKRRVKPRVLIADSSPQSAAFIKQLIGEEYEILISDTGTDAIQEYIRQAPDCVVLDLDTPGLSGVEVAVCIKAIDIQAFIVMMSTDAIQHKIVDAFNCGAGDFIKKPMQRNRLVKAINKSTYISGEPKESLEEMQESEEVFLF